MSDPKERIIACPSCRKSVIYSTANAFRPFCSERCRTQDAAAWATESYRVAAQPANQEEMDGLIQALEDEES